MDHEVSDSGSEYVPDGKETADSSDMDSDDVRRCSKNKDTFTNTLQDSAEIKDASIDDSFADDSLADESHSAPPRVDHDTSQADYDSEERDSVDTMHILIATDCHLGYNETDAIRGNDSFTTFEEILQIANEKRVDFVLLGGDLFHDNKPSRNTLHQCIRLLRKYCFGSRPSQVEFLSDASTNFRHFASANYTDSNLNISLPVFSIHGNHDDPSGLGDLCTLDLLASAGLVNYFGRQDCVEKVVVNPLLLRKNQTKLSLYGIGSMKDERLHRLFLSSNVEMLRPPEDDWFNLMVLHQNRSRHGATSYIPEQYLDSFIDLVFWGHEHECKINPAWNENRNFYVTQPGSSIATSLSIGESVKKHVGILHINKRQFKINKIALETVRPFVMQDLMLAKSAIDPQGFKCDEKVMKYCESKVNELILLAEKQVNDNEKQPKLPLIRLRVDYNGGFELFNIHRFGQQFVNKVSNPKDIISFIKRKCFNKESKDSSIFDNDMDLDLTALRENLLDSSRVEDMVKEYFLKIEKGKGLKLLPEKKMREAIKLFVDKEEKDSINNKFLANVKRTQDYLKKRSVEADQIDSEILDYTQSQINKSGSESEDDEELLKSMKDRQITNYSSDSDDSINSTSKPIKESKPARGRGSRGGRGRAGAAARGRGRGKGRTTKTSSNQLSIQESFAISDSDSEKPKASKRSKKSEPKKSIMCSSDDDIY